MQTCEPVGLRSLYHSLSLKNTHSLFLTHHGLKGERRRKASIKMADKHQGPGSAPTAFRKGTLLSKKKNSNEKTTLYPSRGASALVHQGGRLW